MQHWLSEISEYYALLKEFYSFLFIKYNLKTVQPRLASLFRLNYLEISVPFE